MRPVWVSRGLCLPREQTLVKMNKSEDCIPVYLCMASQYQASSLEESSTGYVQGAGDDSEGWSRGLTAPMYWKYKDELMAATEDELPDLIASLVEREAAAISAECFVPVTKEERVLIGPTPASAVDIAQNSLLVICAPDVDQALSTVMGSRLLHLKCGTNKLGSRDLRLALETLPTFLEGRDAGAKIYTTDKSGKDLAVGTALAVLCLYSDEQGVFFDRFGRHLILMVPPGIMHSNRVDARIDKVLIRKKLSWIMAAMPAANPSRATLNAVNSFLMKPT